MICWCVFCSSRCPPGETVCLGGGQCGPPQPPSRACKRSAVEGALLLWRPCAGTCGLFGDLRQWPERHVPVGPLALRPRPTQGPSCEAGLPGLAGVPRGRDSPRDPLGSEQHPGGVTPAARPIRGWGWGGLGAGSGRVAGRTPSQ